MTALARRVLDSERTRFTEVNLVIAGDRYLRSLNRRYLGRDRPTNVISFDLGRLAEVYVSRDRARSQEQLLYLIAHGLLHLVGYDHRDPRSRTMMERQCRRCLARD